jgi:hypothetical protein
MTSDGSLNISPTPSIFGGSKSERSKRFASPLIPTLRPHSFPTKSSRHLPRNLPTYQHIKGLQIIYVDYYKDIDCCRWVDRFREKFWMQARFRCFAEFVNAWIAVRCRKADIVF